MKAIVGQPPKRPAVRASLARAEFLLSSGDPRAAIVCARRVLRDDPEQIGALELLAKAQWQLARFDALLVTLQSLTRLNPYEPGYHALRGAALQALGRIGEAIKAFARAGDSSHTASASVEELRALQRLLITDLLSDDPGVSRSLCARSRLACRARGFEFLSDYHGGENWLATPRATVLAHIRPS